MNTYATEIDGVQVSVEWVDTTQREETYRAEARDSRSGAEAYASATAPTQRGAVRKVMRLIRAGEVEIL